MKLIVLALLAIGPVSLSAFANNGESTKSTHVLKELNTGSTQNPGKESKNGKALWNVKKWGVVDPVNARLE